MAQRIEYCPPEAEQLERLARAVCREMGIDQRSGSIAYDLAGFMKVIARACAKDLNRKQGKAFDNECETE